MNGTHIRSGLLGTSVVARMMGVTDNTVKKWIDTGRLPGVRLPGSRFRRVRPEDLADFARANGLPAPALGGRPAGDRLMALFEQVEALARADTPPGERLGAILDACREARTAAGPQARAT